MGDQIVGDQIEALRPHLNAVLSALNLPTDEPLLQSLLRYLTLLQRWNAHYNLTAIREPGKMLSQHLADCLAVIHPLRRHVGTAPHIRVLDVGSGGGLPGAVIAMLLPEVEVVCVDTVGKKAAFVQQVAATLNLRNLQSRHARVEQMTEQPFDIVTARAFASLAEFVRLTDKRLRHGGVWLAMKGKSPRDEIDLLQADVYVFHVEQLVVPSLDAERNLIWMQRRSETRSL